MSKAKVLLVDDEEEFAETLAMRLETRGLRVETACDGETALQKVKQQSFDAVLLDLAMPGIGGIETLRQIRQLSPEAQVILLTGRATVKTATEAMRLGAMDLLEKPTDIAELVEKISEAATKRTRLSEERVQQQMGEILGKKGW
jgi:DNA-binding NtrC family response regulator